MKVDEIEIRTMMEARQPTGEWYPVEILSRCAEPNVPAASKKDAMFRVLIHYPDRVTAKGLRCASEIRPRTNTE